MDAGAQDAGQQDALDINEDDDLHDGLLDIDAADALCDTLQLCLDVLDSGEDVEDMPATVLLQRMTPCIVSLACAASGALEALLSIADRGPRAPPLPADGLGLAAALVLLLGMQGVATRVLAMARAQPNCTV